MAFDAEQVRAQMEARSDEELIEILATRADKEWEPEVYALVQSLLQARGVSPERLMESTPSAFDQADEGVVLRAFLLPVDAHQCRMVLEGAGLECWIADEHAAALNIGLATMVGGVKVVVRRSDRQLAERALEAVPGMLATDRAGDVAADAASCPRCGAPVAPPAEEAAPSGVRACSACGHTWTD